MSFLSLFRRGTKRPARPNAGQRFEGGLVGFPSTFDMRNIKLGLQSTVVMGVECGGCGHRWKDAITPCRMEALDCPECGGTNDVCLNIEVHLVG